MHEMAYVRNVVDIVNERVDEFGGDVEVKAVYLTIGASRDIVEDFFEGLFQYLARGTAAEHAEIVIRRVPLTVRCNQCGFVFPLNIRDEKTWACPACKAARDYSVNSGMEFTIDRIEIVRKDTVAPAAPDGSDEATAADEGAAGA